MSPHGCKESKGRGFRISFGVLAKLRNTHKTIRVEDLSGRQYGASSQLGAHLRYEGAKLDAVGKEL